ncbi:Nramp family divalent metal transporter [Trinickia caryophylli]|uniref:Manganese transport protein n=1 Tax=Trinickia caryophylli TaxID=28094 RepID=A0A1X7FNL9_TRICW|nr:Nramp family divalent metal transporter [Trinickia caryophylli]WQE14182.1 Nramp family divalent metal transporter [Trinickia caryophylli]GLU33315.1 divalent metal cation transporter MntH [Trinickia caryophylli]SMF55269.1 manganese transport protein [Trinickia caryophylli]
MPDRPRGSSARTTARVREVLDGRRRGLGVLLPFAGPAVVVSVAYMDPGNIATNLQAGAGYGYSLLWVVLLANVVAMLFQAISARIGLVTGESLAKLCASNLPRPVVYAVWAVSEIAAMATDLAEFLGGAIGLSLLAHLPLLVGMAITAALTWGLLLMQARGFRPLELAIGALVGVIALAYTAQLFFVQLDWPALAHGTFTPSIADGEALLVAVGIIGATVMPHALFLHSGLTGERIRPRDDGDLRRLVRYANAEVVIALGVAGLVNMAMVAMAAGAFHRGHAQIAEIQAAYHTLTPLFGSMAAGLFLTSLMASGISSSVVGTMAGQMIMRDFLGFAVPLSVRRLVTMVPAFIIVGLGFDATRALVLSQVVLSLAVPVPMIALVVFASRARTMGAYRLGPCVVALAVVCAAAVLGMNGVLVAHLL